MTVQIIDEHRKRLLPDPIVEEGRYLGCAEMVQEKIAHHMTVGRKDREVENIAALIPDFRKGSRSIRRHFQAFRIHIPAD